MLEHGIINPIIINYQRLSDRICTICGNEYKTSCRHCTMRIKTWGLEGTLALMEWAKSSNDITAKELLSFVNLYYVDRVYKREAVQVLKKTLRILGYKGEFIGRIHLYDDYEHIRTREHASGHHWRLRKDNCDICGGNKDLKLHHIIPLSWGGATTDSNCLTLYEVCHRKILRNLCKLLGRSRLLEYLAPHWSEIAKLAKK
jgi:hypothetical protein